MTIANRHLSLIGDRLGAALCLLEVVDPTDPACLRLLYANAAASAAWRVPLDELVGSPLLGALPALEATDLPRCFCAVALEQRSVTVDGFWYPGDDRVPSGTFCFEAFPLGTSRVGLVLERAEGVVPSTWHLRHLASIVDSASDAIISKTLGGTITSWNDAAEELYGYTRAEAVGRTMDLIVPSDRREELRGIFAALRRGERVAELETVRVRQDGTRIDVCLSISPLHDDFGEVVGASAIARCIPRERAPRRPREGRRTGSVGAR
ncbi:MAG TPA: PAS domain S-box protein [Gaiellaceae bacterium]|nr:PAS domain S-box protein [Gaiellaceae bacterium]